MAFSISVHEENEFDGKDLNYTVELDSPDIYNATKAFVEALYATFGWGMAITEYIEKVTDALEELKTEYGVKAEEKRDVEFVLNFADDE